MLYSACRTKSGRSIDFLILWRGRASDRAEAAEILSSPLPSSIDETCGEAR